MKRQIPILCNHDHTSVIGMWESDGLGEFLPGHEVTREQLFDIFGGAGIRVIEDEMKVDDATGVTRRLIRKFEILEFSLCPGTKEALENKPFAQSTDGDLR